MDEILYSIEPQETPTRRSQTSEQERAARLPLTQLANSREMIRATVNVRQVTCGKPG